MKKKTTNNSNGQSHDHGGGGDGSLNVRGEGGATLQNFRSANCNSFIMLMKQIFQNQPEKVNTFQGIMTDFKCQRIDVVVVREKMKELFEGHSALIYRFNALLPEGYEITADEDQGPPKKGVNYEEALHFVYKIKERFQDDDHVYLSFLDILNMFISYSMDIAEVYNEVSSLFGNHPDLLEEFTRFLPDDSTPPPIEHVPYGQYLAQCFNMQSSTTAIKQQLQLDKQHCERDKLITSQDGILSIHSSKLDDGKTIIKEHKKQVEKVRDRRVHDQSQRKLHPSNHRFFDLAFNSINEVEQRLSSSDYEELSSKFYQMCDGGIIKRHGSDNLTDTLLGEFTHILDDSNDFVASSGENIGQLLRSPKLEDINRNQKREVLVSKEGKEKDNKQKSEVLVSKERRENHEKYMGMSIHNLDLSDCEHCDVSYRRLPEDYPISIPSPRTKLDAQVLNDHWVSVTSGSEEESLKHLRWNPYEEILFKCEEDQFELDVLIESVESTAEHAENLYNAITGNEIKIEDPSKIVEHFSVLQLRCIENLYDDHGLEVIEALRKNPIVALPVISSRLKQKQKEWRRHHSEFSKVWAQVYAKNFDKSLDHRSLSFKQEDSQNLKPRALMAEIKEIKEKLSNQEWFQATAAGYKLSPTPHMQFEYSDVEIHEDLYKLFCYACKEIVGKKSLLDKMLVVWTTFLEPMLGVHSRSDRLAAAENRRDGSEDCDAEVSVAKSQSGNVSRVEVLQHRDMAAPDSLANGVLIQSNSQEEREEGEISPSLNGDYDHDGFEGGEDVSSREYCKEEHKGQGGKEHDDIDDKAKVERMCNAQSATDGSLLESSFLSEKPLSKYIKPALREERRESRVIYGNDDFYVLFRLHHILYERILSAKTKSMNSEVKHRVAKDANSPDPYSRFMNALYDLLGGSVDEAKFEGECLAIFGNQSYMLFTLDKLIHKLVKQLQAVANAEMNKKILQLFEYENYRKPERLTHLTYLGNARVILPDENIYRLECSSGPSNLMIWVTDRTNEMPTAINPDHADYLYNDFLSDNPVKEEPQGIMLQRNKRKHGASDEFPDMEGVKVINEIDYVMDCDSFKMKYSQHKEDILYRRRKKQKTWSKHNKAREERYRRFLSKVEINYSTR